MSHVWVDVQGRGVNFLGPVRVFFTISLEGIHKLRHQTRVRGFPILRLSTTIGKGWLKTTSAEHKQRNSMSGDMPENETIFIY